MARHIRQSTAALACRLRADRRGATVIVFALGATALFGLVGLATEGGTWYLEKRHGQNAADGAAIAGALAYYNGQNVATSGTKAAALTGYTSGVTITTGVFSAGSYTANATPPNAVQAVVTTARPRLFSSLFGGGNVTIRESAVAMMANTGPVCMLAYAGGVSFGGSTNVSANGCSVASNATGSQSISGASAPSHVSATQSLVSTGGCSGCTGLTTPPLTYQPATPDPAALTSIEALTLPNKTGTQCNNSGSFVAYNSTKPPTIICKDVKITGNTQVDLTPGTYIFYDANLNLNSGALTCSTCTGTGTSGVTIILTGTSASSIGTISANGNFAVQLTAPATNDLNSAFDGVLFYTDSRAVTGNSVTLTGDSTSSFGGAMYFPSSAVTFIGNGGASVPTCSEIVGYSISFTGNSGVNISGCAAQHVTHIRTVRLAQ